MSKFNTLLPAQDSIERFELESAPVPANTVSVTLTRAWFALLHRDLQLSWRNKADLCNPLIFFLIVSSLFPLGVGPDGAFLSRIATGVIWVGALLATLLSLDSVFRADLDDGALEQLLISPQPLPLLVLAKVFAHWLTTGMLLTLISPLLGLMLFLPDPCYPALLFGLLLGTPLLSLIGAIGSSLTVGLRKSSILLSLLVLPLYIPVLILGTGAVQAAADGLPYLPYLLWLGVLLVAGITLAPFAIAAGLRISVAG